METRTEGSHAADAPASAGDARATPRGTTPSRTRRLTGARWFKVSVTVCSVLLVIAGCAAAYLRLANRGEKIIEAHPVDARIEIANSPAWLDRRIASSLLEEAYQFAQKDDATYARARNILDGEILGDFAGLYTGVDTHDGKAVSRQAIGYNAWIKRVTLVRRNVAKDKSIQTIQIAAEWRQPAAWVRVNDMLYLIDADGTRLPGDYRPEDRAGSRLMVIAGIDLPTINGEQAVPQPGERWATGKADGIGDDLVAAMKMATSLQTQKFAAQIDSIDMTNHAGRKDARAPWIVLNTIWKAADGSPRVVKWGRPIGEEKFYEVQAAVKIGTLNELYRRFNRIDANRDYADIRWEDVRLPNLASEADDPTKPVQG